MILAFNTPFQLIKNSIMQNTVNKMLMWLSLYAMEYVMKLSG